MLWHFSCWLVHFERSHCSWVSKFWIYLSFVRLLPKRDLPHLTREFFNKGRLSLWDFQFHLKEDNMLSLLTNGFTQKFPICFVFFKKWIGFCLINAYSVSHIFFLVKADFFADWIADSVVETEHLFTNIEVALRKQARENLIVSWRKRGKFKFSLPNDNVTAFLKDIWKYKHRVKCFGKTKLSTKVTFVIFLSLMITLWTELMRTFKLPDWENVFPQDSHLWYFWTLWTVFSNFLLEKIPFHMSHICNLFYYYELN